MLGGNYQSLPQSHWGIQMSLVCTVPHGRQNHRGLLDSYDVAGPNGGVLVG